MNLLRDEIGLTLPFALILTFIFSALVGVSFLFVSVNLNQMQSSLHNIQAIAVAEGINERIKARLNTKVKIQPSPEQVEKLEKYKDEFEDEFDEEEDEELLEEEAFNEETDLYDEYYADEILQISRYITFREPPEETDESEQEEAPSEGEAQAAEANVKSIGTIDIPRGTVLQKGIMIVVYKDEKLDLKLEDIVQEAAPPYKPKLPAPIIKSLSPNFCEVGATGSLTVLGENLLYNHKASFNSRDIIIENIKAGPFVSFTVGPDVKPGLVYFNWETAKSEFYVIPKYDGSPKPIIYEIKAKNGNQLLETKAGERGLTITLYGRDLFLQKVPPVIIPDTAGIVPKVKEYTPNGKTITATLDIERSVEPGVHSFTVATEGGLSNTWLFNVLPQEEKTSELKANVATYTSSLTLLDIRVLDNLLPLIDEGETFQEVEKPPPRPKEEKAEDTKEPEVEEGEEDLFGEEVPESQKLTPFANTDLETVWLLETQVTVGMITKTISEVINRQIPKIPAGLLTNGSVEFSGGSYRILGTTSAMTTLVEPTYISNITLKVTGPSEEGEEPEEGKPLPQSPIELGFTPGSYVAVYKEGSEIFDLDYALIKSVGQNTIDLVPPGLMNFHYAEDSVYQFVPPLISKEDLDEKDEEQHIIPRGLALKIPNAANFRNIFGANLEQFSELASLYTNDFSIPKDEFEIPIGYMDLTYIAGTPVYSESNALTGKGILIIDTTRDNAGRPTGTVEFGGDARSPSEFSGIVYVRGNVRIGGFVNIDGALIVDNEPSGKVEIASNAIGMVGFGPRAVRQTILSIPFTTKPGTVMISNKPINLENYVQSGEEAIALGAAPSFTGTTGEISEAEAMSIVSPAELELVEAEVKPQKGLPPTEAIPPPRAPGAKSPEEELIELF